MEMMKMQTENSEAMQLHSDIMASMRMAAGAMVEFCRKLKEMRDKRLYEQLGFEKFEEYAVQMVGIKSRQAYNYIAIYERLSPQLLEQNAGIGVTKLLLLTQVTATEREEFAAEHDLNGLTVEQVRALVDEKNGMAEQISLLTRENTAAAERENALISTVKELKQDAADREKELEKLHAQPDFDEQAIREETEQRVRREMKRAMEQAVQEATDKTLVAANSARIFAVDEARKEERKKAAEKAEKVKAAEQKRIEQAVQDALASEREKLQKESEEKQAAEKEALENAAKAAEAKAEELQKKLAVTADEDTMRFSMLFSAAQDGLNAVLEALNKIKEKDAAKAEKLGCAVKQLLQAMLAAMEGV